MSSTEERTNDFLETLKSNYKKRIQEVDNFSRNFATASADFRSQYLAGLSDMLQYYLDLQKKFTKGYHLWYDQDLASRQSKMITKSFTDTMHNMNSHYTSLLDFGTKNLRIFNQGIIQILQMTEIYIDIFVKVPPTQNMLVAIFNQVKEQNNDFVQKQLPKKKNLSDQKIQTNQVVVKEVS